MLKYKNMILLINSQICIKYYLCSGFTGTMKDTSELQWNFS